MWTDPDQLDAARGAGYHGPAVVLGPAMADRSLPLLLENAAGRTATATVPELAVPDPQTGDTVLVSGPDSERLYVLAVLSRCEDREPRPVSLATGDGGRVEIARTDTGSEVRVYGRRGELLFGYEPRADRAHVHLQTHDLQFHVPGRLAFAAQEDIRLEAPQVAVSADTGRFAIAETSFRGQRLDATLERARLVADRMETAARTVVCRAVNVFRSVEELLQTRAGRARTLVRASYHLKARRTYVKASEDVNIDGEKVNLG